MYLANFIFYPYVKALQLVQILGLCLIFCDKGIKFKDRPNITIPVPPVNWREKSRIIKGLVVVFLFITQTTE